jgi:zinc finger HIT domain-containing protein 3
VASTRAMVKQKGTAAASAASAAPQCQICTIVDSKYRCPACDTKYCSAACFKQHKAGWEASEEREAAAACSGKRRRPGDNEEPAAPLPPALRQPQPETAVVAKRSRVEPEINEEEEGWQLTEEQKGKLEQLDWAKAALRDPKLQALMIKIDEAPDREAELRFHRSNPEFGAFMDRMLQELGLLGRTADGELEFVAQTSGK